MGIFDKFKLGLSKSSKNLSSGLNDLIFKKKIDENMLNELEDFLIQSDVGVESAKELREKFANIKINPKTTGKEEIFKIFSTYVSEILKPLEKNLENMGQNKPSVILIAGVNGVGKTTTVGKLGKILGQNNKKLVFGAADTFRAAAVDQLEVWAKRINADIIKSDDGADPASVAYKALDHAKKNNFDYLLIDTAGRLQNKKNLMDEFKKITKVLKKIDSNTPHETFLILDATTGQNAINQVNDFNAAIPIDGIILTKMDGTTKGGMAIPILSELKIPICYMGTGEKLDDLIPFDIDYYLEGLISNAK